MKLHLGCGPKLLDGFVNVDLPGNWSGMQPDVEADITKRLPFDDQSADEVHAYHVIEHLPRYEIEAILADWARVLKPGGMLVIECPCLDKILNLFAMFIEARRPVDPRLTIWGLYGDPSYRNEAMMHKWCYGKTELSALLEGLGMDVIEEHPQYHQPVRDMRMIGRK